MLQRSIPWWVVSLGVALLAAVAFLLFLAIPWWWGKAALGVAVVAFLLMIGANPAYWHRRIAGVLVGMWSVVIARPAFKVVAQWNHDRFAELLLEAESWPFHAIIGGLLVVILFIDYWRHLPTASHDSKSSNSDRRAESHNRFAVDGPSFRAASLFIGVQLAIIAALSVIFFATGYYVNSRKQERIAKIRERATAFFQQREYAQAVETYSELMLEDGGSPDSFWMRGRAFLEMNK